MFPLVSYENTADYRSSTSTIAVATGKHQPKERHDNFSPATAAEYRANGDVKTKVDNIERETDIDTRPNSAESAEAGQISLPSERKGSSGENTQARAAAEAENAEGLVVAERVDTKDVPSLPAPAANSGSTDKSPQGVSLGSRPQEADTTPGAFPKDDSESVYSELSSDREAAQEHSDTTEKPSTRELETMPGSTSDNKDTFESHSVRKRYYVGSKAKPAFSIGPEDSESSSIPSGEANLLNDEYERGHSSLNIPEDLSARHSRDGDETTPEAPSQPWGFSCSPAKADTDQQPDPSPGHRAASSEYPEEKITEPKKDNISAHGSTETSTDDRPTLHGTYNSEGVPRDLEINQPYIPKVAAVPDTYDQRNSEGQDRQVMHPGHDSAEATPSHPMEEPNVTQAPETPQSGRQRAVSVANKGNGIREAQKRVEINSDVSEESESEPEGITRRAATMPVSMGARRGSTASKPEPKDVIRRMSAMPASINDRRSSKPAKKVTLPPPKIFVQSPSEVTQDDEPIDPHPTPAEPLHNDEYRIISRNGSVVSVQHTVTSAAERLGTSPVKKRKLYIRKARNLAARPIFINAVLGRKMGKQAKDRLRRLARGEEVPKYKVSTQPRAANAPQLGKRKSFLRRARSTALRQVFLDAALGKQIAGETKPALQRMAAGESVVFDEAQDPLLGSSEAPK